MGCELLNQPGIHNAVFDFLPVVLALLLVLSSKLKGFRGSLGSDQLVLLRQALKLQRLEVVFVGGICLAVDFEWRRKEVAQEPILVLGSIKTDWLGVLLGAFFFFHEQSGKYIKS